MDTSNKIYHFEASVQQGKILLTAKEYPWSVLQVVPTTPETFDKVVELCDKRGMVAKHDSDKSFIIIHLCSGDQDGKYPEHHISLVSPGEADKYLAALKDCMAQAAVWYYSNVIVGHLKF